MNLLVFHKIILRRKPIKICIAGSRLFPSMNILKYADWEIPHKRLPMCKILLDCIEKSKYDITEVVSGTCWGIDQLGEAWAKISNIPIKQFPADWDGDGKSAGFIRNAKMAEYADGLISIHSGSYGSRDMIECMSRLNKTLVYERPIK